MTASKNTSQAYGKELLLNQTWQVLNFASKAGFLILLTPLMISRWGTVGYGLFALASSLLVSMALLDGGIRSLTRIEMADAWKRGNEEAARVIYTQSLLTFLSLCILAIAASITLALSGWMNQLLHLPPGGSSVLVLAVSCTAVLMFTLLALEPLAARGQLSALKAANTWGAIASIPLCGILVLAGASIGSVVLMNALCLTIPNLIMAWRSNLFVLISWKEISEFRPSIAWKTLKSGIWYYLTTVSLITKTHALTFLVSAMAGPAEAGLFYILLRLSEIVGNVGATSSETSLAALASSVDESQRKKYFRQSWLHVSLFCTHGALALTFLIGELLSLWVPNEGTLSPFIGVTLAAFGLVGAFSRVVVNASMGLNLTHLAALAGIREALLSITGSGIGYHLGGLPGLFLGGSLGIIFLLPVSRKISEQCGWHSAWNWLCELKGLLPGFFLSAAILYAASLSSHAPLWFAALAASGAILLWQLTTIHAQE